MVAVIETNSLTKTYGSLVAVNKLNLKVEKNTIHGFLGPNGAGKSTTIKVLIGLLKADSGSAKILGQEIGWDRPETRAHVGYMPELPKLPKHLKGTELLDIYGRMYGMTEAERAKQVPELLDVVGLGDRGTDLIGQYSKGMQQRLGLAQALLNAPELVILDEPSLGLDPVGMVEVRDLMKKLAKQGTTIFLSSHLLHEVQQVCTQVTIINRGVEVTSGSLEEISSRVEGPLKIEVEVNNLSKPILEKLEALPFVDNVSRSGKKLLIELTTRDDVRSEVSQAITNAGGVVVAMNLKGESLEDVFIDLLGTREKES
ncbi:MAG: ABC transporter ATP-binding protein [Candidatus Bathyarchaeota archaeon]|nr:MAG: ABC transporter ATP-binding protein [Candidatus Bathyarchaeota archaeon]